MSNGISNYVKPEDAAAIPVGFGLFEDFLTGVLTDSTGGTPATTLADLTGTYSQALAEAAVAELAAVVNAGGSFGYTPIAAGTLTSNAANGGWARISGPATTDDAGGQLQARGIHVLANDKNVSFKARGKVSETTSTNSATESDLWLGLMAVDTSIVASAPTDYVVFRKDDGGTTIKCEYRIASATAVSFTVPAATFTMVAGTTYAFGISVQPRSGANSIIEWSVDGVVVYRLTGIDLSTLTVALTPSVAFQTGDATGTKFLDLDYIGSYQVR